MDDQYMIQTWVGNQEEGWYETRFAATLDDVQEGERVFVKIREDVYQEINL